MAVPTSAAENEKEAVEKYNRITTDYLKREARLKRQYEWRGNKLPPFNIEPMPYERQRLSGAGMTAVERAARKQWVMDQELAPHEPVYIKELYPRNIFKRITGGPWDAMFSALTPYVGKASAVKWRYRIPKLAIAVSLAYLGWYHLKYNHSTWEIQGRWNVLRSQVPVMPGEPGWPKDIAREKDDFRSQGFKERKALLD